MACGEYGEGKMSEPNKISNEINNYFLNLKNCKKLKALVTAGPTNEYIDPVRFITNKSSGKQGYEIAKSLSKKGFDTTLISGPTNLTIDADIKLIEVETADEMLLETQKNLPANVAVFSAAVADFKINKKLITSYINRNKQTNINLFCVRSRCTNKDKTRCTNSKPLCRKNGKECKTELDDNGIEQHVLHTIYRKYKIEISVDWGLEKLCRKIFGDTCSKLAPLLRGDDATAISILELVEKKFNNNTHKSAGVGEAITAFVKSSSEDFNVSDRLRKNWN
jgi:hypothetical protein